MGLLRFVSLLLLLLLLLLPAVLAAVQEDGSSVNGSSLIWPINFAESFQALQTSAAVTDDEDPLGGFDSLDSMLQWAIGHSDPETLKGAAQRVQNLTPAEVEVRQAAIQELMESLKMPSDADLMKIAIADLQNTSSSIDNRQRALQELLELVEPIDNANDLHKLGGLTAIVEELNRPEEDLRVLAAWILGKASQNNGLVQDQLLEIGVLQKLMQMAQSSSAEEAVKALYAVSAIIRSHPLAQETFYLEGGMLLLENLMKNAKGDVRIHRKSLFLVADLAEQHKETGGVLAKYIPSKSYLMSVVSLVLSEDLDTQEKALMAIHSLRDSNQEIHNRLRNECGVISALQKLCLQLEKLVNADDQLEFVVDLQTRCQNVMSMFLEDWKNNEEISKSEALPTQLSK